MTILDFAAHVQDYTQNVLKVLLWVVFLNLINWIFLGSFLNYFGIHPRKIRGLLGILFAPVLHGNLGHIFSNAIPFYALSLIMIATLGPHDYLINCFIISLVSGALIWIAARPGIHIGASALITGMYGWLVALTYAEPNLLHAFMLGILFLYFGTILLGVLPAEEHVSWEGHLLGLVAGVLAYYYHQELMYYFYEILYFLTKIGVFLPF